MLLTDPGMALSTPHGALGTLGKFATIGLIAWELSTPHGALGTTYPEKHQVFQLNLSTPHGALGTCP